jgi:hypothetical protein
MRTFTFVLFGVLGILGTASLDCSFKGISVNWLQVHGGPPAKGANIGTRDSRTLRPRNSTEIAGLFRVLTVLPPIYPP